MSECLKNVFKIIFKYFFFVNIGFLFLNFIFIICKTIKSLSFFFIVLFDERRSILKFIKKLIEPL